MGSELHSWIKSGPHEHDTFMGDPDKPVIRQFHPNSLEFEIKNINPEIYSFLLGWDWLIMHSLLGGGSYGYD